MIDHKLCSSWLVDYEDNEKQEQKLCSSKSTERSILPLSDISQTIVHLIIIEHSFKNMIKNQELRSRASPPRNLISKE